MIRATFADHDPIDTEPPGEPPPPRFDADPAQVLAVYPKRKDHR